MVASTAEMVGMASMPTVKMIGTVLVDVKCEGYFIDKHWR